MKNIKILQPYRDENTGKMKYREVDAPVIRPEPVAIHAVRTNDATLPDFSPSELTRKRLEELKARPGGDAHQRETTRRRIKQYESLLAEQEYRERLEDVELARLAEAADLLTGCETLLGSLPDDLGGQLVWAKSEFEAGHISADVLSATMKSLGHMAQRRVIDEEVSEIHATQSEEEKLFARLEQQKVAREKRRAIFEKIGEIVGFEDLDNYDDEGNLK